MKDDDYFSCDLHLSYHKSVTPKQVAMVARTMDKIALFSRKFDIPIQMGGIIDVTGN